jgi:hypothetical protein
MPTIPSPTSFKLENPVPTLARYSSLHDYATAVRTWSRVEDTPGKKEAIPVSLRAHVLRAGAGIPHSALPTSLHGLNSLSSDILAAPYHDVGGVEAWIEKVFQIGGIATHDAEDVAWAQLSRERRTGESMQTWHIAFTEATTRCNAYAHYPVPSHVFASILRTRLNIKTTPTLYTLFSELKKIRQTATRSELLDKLNSHIAERY